MAQANEIKISVDADTTKASKGIGNLKIAALGVGAGIGVIGIAALKMGDELQSAYNTIRANTGATGKDLEGLKGDFKEILKGVPADFATASEAMAELNTRMGLTGKPLQEMSKQVLNLARVSGVDATTAVKSATRVFGDWGIGAGKSKKTMDMLFRATQVSGVGFDKLAGTLVAFGAPLRAAGFSIEESTALLSKWEKEGVNAELVLGAFKIAQSTFAREGIPMREGLADTIAKITELGPSAEATGLAMKTFGSRAGGDMAAAILEGRFSIDDYMESIAGGSDTINAVAADTMTWRDELTLLKNQAVVALEPALSALVDGIGLLIDGIKLLVVWIRDNLGPVFEAFITLIKPKMDEFFVFLQEKFDEFLVYFDATIKPAIENIQKVFETVFGGIVDFLREHWDEIEPIIMTVIDIVTGRLEMAFDLITGLFDALMLLISGDFSGAWRALKETIIGLFEDIVDQIKLFFTLFGQIIPLFFDIGVAIGKALLKGIKTLGGKIGQWLWDQIKKAIDLLPERLKSGIRNIFGVIKGVAGGVGDILTGGEIAQQRAGVGSGLMGSFATVQAAHAEALMLSRTGRNVGGDTYIINMTGLVTDPVATGEQVIKYAKIYKDSGGPMGDLLSATN